jgi:hypothetical protein
MAKHSINLVSYLRDPTLFNPWLIVYKTMPAEPKGSLNIDNPSNFPSLGKCTADDAEIFIF